METEGSTRELLRPLEDGRRERARPGQGEAEGTDEGSLLIDGINGYNNINGNGLSEDEEASEEQETFHVCCDCCGPKCCLVASPLRIVAKRNRFFTCFCDALNLPRHFLRATSSNIGIRLFSTSEEEVLGDLGISEAIIVNYLSWRRSVMLLAFITMIGTAYLHYVIRDEGFITGLKLAIADLSSRLGIDLTKIFDIDLTQRLFAILQQVGGASVFVATVLVLVAMLCGSYVFGLNYKS